MSMLLLKKWWDIASAWCRQHWRWLIMIVAFAVVYILGKRQNKVELIQAKLALKQYEKEKNAIIKAYNTEKELKERAAKKYNEALRTVSDEYKGNVNSLNFKKENEIREMLKKAKNSPDEIDDILEKELGIKKQ